MQAKAFLELAEQYLGFYRVVSTAFEIGNPRALLRDVALALADVPVGLGQMSLDHCPIHAARIAQNRRFL
jgi:hypothetical protein